MLKDALPTPAAPMGTVVMGMAVPWIMRESRAEEGLSMVPPKLRPELRLYIPPYALDPLLEVEASPPDRCMLWSCACPSRPSISLVCSCWRGVDWAWDADMTWGASMWELGTPMGEILRSGRLRLRLAVKLRGLVATIAGLG